MCLVSCVGALWYALQAQQAHKQARQDYYYSSYTQVVDKSVDNFISVDFVVNKFWDGVGKVQNVRAYFTPKNSNNYKALYHAKVCVLCNFSIVKVSNF